MRLFPRFISGLAVLASFGTLSARAADLAGTLTTGPIGSIANNFNLTTMNGEVDSVIDWVVWGQGTDTNLAGSNRKSGGSAIGALTFINPASQPLRALGQFDLGETFQWTDGSPTGSASNVQTGLQINVEVTTAAEALGSGWTFQITGSAAETRRVYLWAGVGIGTATYTASLNFATPVSLDLVPPSGPNGDIMGLFKYDFKPNSDSDLLTITGIMTAVEDNGFGGYFSNTSPFAAAIGVITPVPEIDPATGSSALSLVAGVLAMIEQRRRRAALVA
jgi:hypothetical protein